MPPRRRTFYLADATLLSNPKIRRLQRTHPDDWLSVLGAFHVLIGVATLNGSPKLAPDEIDDVLGGHEDVVTLLRATGLMTATGIDRATYNEWCPKARPQYPSDKKPRPHSGGKPADSGGVGTDSAGVGGDSAGMDPESGGMPTSTTSSSSVSIAASSSPSRGVGSSATKKNDGSKTRTKEEALLTLSEDFKAGKFDELEYKRRRDEVNAA